MPILTGDAGYSPGIASGAYKPGAGGSSQIPPLPTNGPTWVNPPPLPTGVPSLVNPPGPLTTGPGAGGGGGTGTASAPGPAPAPNTPPDITTDPGSSPDTGALIQSDPGYQAWKQAADQQEAASRAQRAAALRQAVLQYGGLPEGWSDQYGDIDQATLDAAKGNQFSTLASLSNNYDQSKRQFLSQLAARGALQSGDLNYGQDQLDRSLGQQRYDAANAFGQTAVGAENAYTDVLGQIAQGRVGAVQGAEQNLASNPGYAPTPKQTAAYDASSSSLYGQPVYKSVGPDGTPTYYSVDGTALGSGDMSQWFTNQRKSQGF